MLRSILRQFARQIIPSARRRITLEKRAVGVETLEARLLLSADLPGHDIFVTPSNAVSPFSTSGPTGLSPAQVRQAYGFNTITFANGAITGDGAGTTIAIVDAYNHPNIASDLHQFDLQFGLPDPVFTKVNQRGGTTYPSNDAGWAGEIALDVEWAHAIAPKANILLVEADDNSMDNLMAAVDYARHVAGVVAISMSWGGSEFSGEKSYDSYFTTPAGHAGVSFFASSGDDGAPTSYPSASPNVVSVGGTTLNLNSSGNYSSESAWSGSGGGISVYESQPAYQRGVVTQSTTKRTSPDVAYDADPNSGFSVYNSFGTTSGKPWVKFGGTSAGAPQWAALAAIVDQGRALAGLGSLDGATQLLPKLYTLPAADFHDVTSGSSSGTPSYAAQAGYDLATGRGSPYANLVVNELVGGSTTTNPPATPVATHFSITASAGSTVAGSAFSFTVSALDASNNVVTGYVGTVHFTSSDAQGVPPGNYTFTTADKGVHSFSVTLKTAGSQNIKGVDTANSALNGTLTLTVTPAAASRLAFTQQPTQVSAGAAISPAVTVKIYDAYNNLLTGDNTDTVTISLGTNPGSSVLSGTTSVKVTGGVATFSTLSLNQVGTGYTLVARSGTLAAATSSAFNVISANPTIEGFDGGTFNNYYYTGSFYSSAYIESSARHDGSYGMLDTSGNDWIYRNDSTVHVKQGDTISVWMRFSGSATGVAAFGFGASSGGTLSIVASPRTNQLLLTNNVGYGSTTIGSASQTWQANHWYRLEVAWSTTGAIVGRVYDTNGTALLQSASATTNAITNGGIAFKANGSSVNWDTVQLVPGVNTFASHSSATSGRSSVASLRGITNLSSLLGPQSRSASDFAGVSPMNVTTPGNSNEIGPGFLDSLFGEFSSLSTSGSGQVSGLDGKHQSQHTASDQDQDIGESLFETVSNAELDHVFRGL